MLKIYLFILCAIMLSISAETNSLENNKNSDFLSLLRSGQNVYQSNELKQHLSNKRNVREIQNSSSCKGQVLTKTSPEAYFNDASKFFYDPVKTTSKPTHEKSGASQLPSNESYNNVKKSHYYNNNYRRADSTQDSNEYLVKEGLGTGLSAFDQTKAELDKSIEHNTDETSNYNNPNAESSQDYNIYETNKPLENYLRVYSTKYNNKGANNYNYPNTDSSQDSYVYKVNHTPENLMSLLEIPKQNKGLPLKYNNKFNMNNIYPNDDSAQGYHSLLNKLSPLSETNKNCDNEANKINTNKLNEQLVLNHVNNVLKDDLRNAFSLEGMTEEQGNSEERDLEPDESQNESYGEKHVENIDNGSNSEDCPKKVKKYSKVQSAVTANRRVNKGVNIHDSQLDKLGDVANQDLDANVYKYQRSSKKDEALAKIHIDSEDTKAENVDNFSLLRNQLIDPAKGPGVISLAERRLLLSNAPHLTCYACSTLSNPTCLHPDRRTTAKYCSKEHNACIKKVYEVDGDSIIVRDCATSCNDAPLGPLVPKYKNCEICHEELCNGVLNLHSSTLILVVSVIFIKHVL